MITTPLSHSNLRRENATGFSNRTSAYNRQRKPSSESDLSLELTMIEIGDAEEYKFNESSHSHMILYGLNALRKKGQFCDVTLLVEGTKFPAHRNVLAAFSPYFKAMFLGNLVESRQEEVAVNGIESDMMSLLLDYAYSSQVVITLGNVQSLLGAANLLQVIPVREAACLFLAKHMDITNCVGIHCFAETHACDVLQDTAFEFAMRNFYQVGMQDEILGLSPSKLVEFISHDDLEVEKEEIVFQIVMRWFNHSPESRRGEFPKILEHVRLPQISPYFLHDCVESLAIVRQSPEAKQLIDEAKRFHLLPDRRIEFQSERTRSRKNAHTKQVIVAVGGEDDQVVLRSVDCYDPELNIWLPLACLPFAISKHGLVASGRNTLYLAGGEYPDGSASRSVWRFDPILDVWHEMASMLTPRSELGLAMLDGSVYAIGGWDGTIRLNTVERYDPETNSWHMIAPMQLAVTSPAVVAHDGMLYVTGGAILEDGDGIDLVNRYNPKTDSWTKLASMLIPRSGSAACVLEGYIYVIGGWHASTENTNKVERYDVQTNSWEFRKSMCERRYRPGVAVHNGNIFVLGGEEGWDKYHDTIECYNVESDTWCLAGDMPTSRSWLSCVPLQVKKQIGKAGS